MVGSRVCVALAELFVVSVVMGFLLAHIFPKICFEDVRTMHMSLRSPVYLIPKPTQGYYENAPRCVFQRAN